MIRFAVVALSAITITAPLSASAHRTDSYRSINRPAIITADSARIAESLRRAMAFAAAGRAAEARREYRSLVAIERAGGGYPATALWHLANAYFAADNLGGAARTLDELAYLAGEIVDPSTELRARLEAAVLWARLKNMTRARDGLNRVRVLLKSPAISPAERAWARQRIGE